MTQENVYDMIMRERCPDDSDNDDDVQHAKRIKIDDELSRDEASGVCINLFGAESGKYTILAKSIYQL